MQRKSYTQKFKQQVIKEALETRNYTIVARCYDVNLNVLARWVREYKNNGNSSSNAFNVISPDTKQLEAENDRRKKILGEKKLENQILRDLLKKQTLTC